MTVDNRATTQDLVYGELRSIHGTLKRIYEDPSNKNPSSAPTKEGRTADHFKKIGEHIIHHLASIDERLCEANGLLYNTKQEREFKVKYLTEEKRLKVLRQQNDEMREVLYKVYTKACEISKLKDQIVKDANNLAKNRTHYLACNSFYFDAAIENAKDIENIIPVKYLP